MHSKERCHTEKNNSNTRGKHVTRLIASSFTTELKNVGQLSRRRSWDGRAKKKKLWERQEKISQECECIYDLKNAPMLNPARCLDGVWRKKLIEYVRRWTWTQQNEEMKEGKKLRESNIPQEPRESWSWSDRWRFKFNIFLLQLLCKREQRSESERWASTRERRREKSKENVRKLIKMLAYMPSSLTTRRCCSVEREVDLILNSSKRLTNTHLTGEGERGVPMCMCWLCLCKNYVYKRDMSKQMRQRRGEKRKI